ICISVQRVFVHAKIFDSWTDKFVSSARSLKKGDPENETTQLSSLIDTASAERIEKWVNEAVENNAKLLCGGIRDKSFFDATVLTNVDPELPVASEEAFGPVAVIERFDDFGDAVGAANQSKYGLQAGVFTQDLANANFAAEHLEFGSVIVNDVPSFRVDNMPYGGTKNSGFGREGVRYAMEEMTELRLIVTEP
ncbi:MAG: aldehyde dehydrogenase family protein, partial [Acidobacteria bacterium]|nr:aldehyde dehydrogenase family protein [Acidobacteriota bacterium]